MPSRAARCAAAGREVGGAGSAGGGAAGPDLEAIARSGMAAGGGGGSGAALDSRAAAGAAAGTSAMVLVFSQMPRSSIVTSFILVVAA